MKQSSMLVAALLVAASATLVSCSGSDNKKAAPAARPVVAVADGEVPAINIRYVDQDSLMAQYDLAKDLRDLGAKKEKQYNDAAAAQQAKLQKMANDIESKVRNNGYLSEESYNGDMNRLNQSQQQAAAAMAKLERQLFAEAQEYQQELSDSLDNFISEYAAQNGFNAIIYKNAAAYLDPALDVTDEVVKGLNARYNKKK